MRLSNTRRLCSLLAVCLFVSSLAAAQATVRAWEGTITLPTYAWHDDANPEFREYGGRNYYPYTRQDHIEKTKAPRTYKALFLENEYLRVTCLPELGGRIHSVFDKTTNEEMFHKNDEIKPALIAMRGAWISGGIEWNVGPQGHTVTIVSPVDALLVENDDGSASLVVGNTEKMFRTRWTVRVTLHPGKAYLDESMRMYNPTDGVHSYYFWNCTAFPNLPGTRFIYPMTLGCDHNGTTFFKWPVHEDKDMTWLKNYPTMSSVFGYECVFDFFGAYDADRDRGIVSYANHHEVKGKKAWTWGKDDFGVVSQMALSDAGPVHAQYIEVQSGPLLTQSDYGMLKPRQEVAWREYWYPAHGLGDGFEYATRDAVVQATRKDDGLELRILATGAFPDAVCTLSQDGKTLSETTLNLSPLEAERIRLANPPEGPIAVALRTRDGAELLAYEMPLAIPLVEEPDLTKKPARPDGEPTAEEKFHEGYLRDSQFSPAGARKGYEEALAIDPLHVPSLCALAELDIEIGRFDDAAARAGRALERDPDHGMAWYLLGVARLNEGNYDAALACGYKSARALDTLALGYNLVGRANMRLGVHEAAASAFARALSGNPLDSRNRNQWLAARYASGDDILAEARAISSQDDPTDIVLRALIALCGGMSGFVQDVGAIVGEKEFTVLETAVFFANLDLYAEAVRILESFPAGELGALPHYYLAYYQHQAGDEEAARGTLKRAGSLPIDYVFPSRVEAEAVLDYAVATRPSDAHAHALRGHLYAALRQPNEAQSEWKEAVKLDDSLSAVWRLLALHACKKDDDLEEAEDCLRNATEARPADQIPYRDLASILTTLKRRTEAIELVEAMPRDLPLRYDICLWLARAYVDEKRYDDCIDMFRTARFSNWEGQTGPRDIWVSALMARGKERFEAGKLEDALNDFQTALTHPENLEVGARYKLTNAETRYWQGKTLMALNRPEEAKAAWQAGAEQVTSADMPLPSIHVSSTQDDYVKRCATALELLNLHP